MAAMRLLQNIDGVGPMGPPSAWLATSGMVYRRSNHRHQAQAAWRVLEAALANSEPDGKLECYKCGWRGDGAIIAGHPINKMQKVRICPDCGAIEEIKNVGTK